MSKTGQHPDEKDGWICPACWEDYLAHKDAEDDPGTCVIDRLVRGPVNGKYLVAWKGYEGADTWEPTANLNPAIIEQYECLSAAAATGTGTGACEAKAGARATGKEAAEDDSDR